MISAWLNLSLSLSVSFKGIVIHVTLQYIATNITHHIFCHVTLYTMDVRSGLCDKTVYEYVVLEINLLLI